jgi:hypothetical protein
VCGFAARDAPVVAYGRGARAAWHCSCVRQVVVGHVGCSWGQKATYRQLAAPTGLPLSNERRRSLQSTTVPLPFVSAA